VHDLRAGVESLRPLRPDGPRYKLWLGDVVELVQTIWGPGSLQLSEVAAAVRGPVAPDDAAALRYLKRLQRLDRVLEDLERQLSAT
jgi:hypothetical protein